MLSAFFAGISGGLTAINFEIVSAENVSALRSGLILLFTVIGGAGFFFGPMIGAIIGVFLTVMLSDFTSAWQLYFGMFFVLIVMYAPGGIAGLIMHIPGLIRSGKIKHVLPQLTLALLAGLLALTGFMMMVEMLYHLSFRAADGRSMQMFGFRIDTAQAYGWLLPTLLIATGLPSWIMLRKRLIHVWNAVTAENLDDEKQARA
jgi:branched-chain amino acid transport system permease protein